MDHRGSGCGLEEELSYWMRVREEKRQSENALASDCKDQMDGWRHCLPRRKGRFWGVRIDSIRHDGCPWDSHVETSN